MAERTALWPPIMLNRKMTIEIEIICAIYKYSSNAGWAMTCLCACLLFTSVGNND